MTFGNTITNYRKNLGITQEALAQRLEVTNQAVSKWESDLCCPDIQLLPKLADIFGISIDALFGREPAARPAQKVFVEGLPWEEDKTLRAVLYVGHTLIGHSSVNKTSDPAAREIHFVYEGPALNVSSDLSVTCGDVEGNVDAGSSVTCGNVAGDVDAGADVRCGAVGGDVDAGANVNCTDVSGDVDAGYNVTCGEIGGDVDAGGDVKCAGVGGAVDAGGDVKCADVGGDVDAGGDVTCASVSGSVDAGGSVMIQK